MLENLLVTLDRWPRTCQAVLVVLLVAAGFYLPRLKIDDSPERWLPADTRAAWKVLDDHFNFGDTVAVGLEYLRPIQDDDVKPLHKFRDELAAIKGMREVYDASLVAEDIEGVPLSEMVAPGQRQAVRAVRGGAVVAAAPRSENRQKHADTIDCLRARLSVRIDRIACDAPARDRRDLSDRRRIEARPGVY